MLSQGPDDVDGLRVEGSPEMTTFGSLVVTALAIVVFMSPEVAQSPVGALAIDERQGDQWGWAVDYETAAAAQGMALQECGPGCSVVLTFGRCAAYAADQDANSTAVGENPPNAVHTRRLRPRAR